MSSKQAADAIDTEITRSQNYIRYIESKLSPDQMLIAQRMESSAKARGSHGP
jgi:hypothetical protein